MARRITRDINSVTFNARLGSDPEMVDAGGHDLCKFRVAVNRWNKKNKENDTDWYHVNVWGEEGKHAYSMLEKGHAVIVKGRLAIEQWTNKEGQERLTPTITADSVFVVDAAVCFAKSSSEANESSKGAVMPQDGLPF